MREVSSAISERAKSKQALERIHLMHRRYVGPTTAAETLPFVYEELTRSQSPSYLYAAGWVAIEAGISATDSPIEERLFRIRQASDALELARDNAMELAFLRAEQRGHYPEYSLALRISTTMAFLPLFECLAQGSQPEQDVIQECYSSLLHVAIQTSEELVQTQQIDPGRTGGYIGLLHEQHTMLAVNRRKSESDIAVPSLERADKGDRYQSRTHDVQLLQIDHGTVKNVTPYESKIRLLPSDRERYEAALVGGNTHFKTRDIPSLVHLTWRFDREEKGQASRKERKRLDCLTREILHLRQHYHRPLQLGRHCLGIARCRVA